MATAVGYEIDFLAVGDGERSGDAIAVRYGIPGAYRVMVFDGGNKDSGQALVDHIRTHYGTNHVDYVVNTHPDVDHASGLEIVLEQMTVGQVWVHRPWNYPLHILRWCADGRITATSLRARLQEAMCHAHRLQELADRKRIPVYEPFQGSRIGEFVVLSPSRDWYLQILPHFDKTPEVKIAPPAGLGGLLGRAGALAEKFVAWLDEALHIETLKDGGETSFDNESSVVLYGWIANRGILLTGDAGVQALSRAAAYCEANRVSLPDSLNFIQIPHHGSRHNVGPTILNRILGPIRVPSANNDKTAYVSAGAKSETHPRRAVTNAFKRRGCKVFQAKGDGRCHRYGMPLRAGWNLVDEVPFFDKVEG